MQLLPIYLGNDTPIYDILIRLEKLGCSQNSLLGQGNHSNVQLQMQLLPYGSYTADLACPPPPPKKKPCQYTLLCLRKPLDGPTDQWILLILYLMTPKIWLRTHLIHSGCIAKINSFCSEISRSFVGYFHMLKTFTKLSFE